jgi:5'-AMP-activated protein kinase catalytic alpha subunit
MMDFSDKHSLEDYIIGKQIGQGAYAVVRVGLHKPSNKKIAMKIYEKQKLQDPQRYKSVKREIKIMERMNHPNIIRLYEVIETKNHVVLIMEYAEGGSLHGFLKAKPHRRCEEEEARRFMR